MAKTNKKIIKDEEDFTFNAEEIGIEVKDVEIPNDTPVINPELEQLKKLHKEMTDRGIKDIGQLEVLISRLQ